MPRFLTILSLACGLTLLIVQFNIIYAKNPKNIYGLEFRSIKIDLQYDNTLHLNKCKMPILQIMLIAKIIFYNKIGIICIHARFL
jgi:hypothetical protein